MAKRTYRNLVPGPYWPDTGHAQTTFTALLLMFVAATLRSSKKSMGTVEGRTGMIFQYPKEASFGTKCGILGLHEI